MKEAAKMKAAHALPDRTECLRLYEQMVLLRQFELAAQKNYKERRMPGFIHLYVGEEAVGVGVCANLRKEDWITSTHRGHGHALAKGLPARKLMAELYGRATGNAKGRGGSMHFYTPRLLGGSGIVGGQVPLAVGAGNGGGIEIPCANGPAASKPAGNQISRIVTGAYFEGDVVVNQGTNDIESGGAFTVDAGVHYLQSGGATVLNGGTLTVPAGFAVAGTLRGTGTVVGNVTNSGDVTPDIGAAATMYGSMPPCLIDSRTSSRIIFVFDSPTSIAVGRGIFGIWIFMYFWISRSLVRSRGVTRVIALPLFPARPVRPIRWT